MTQRRILAVLLVLLVSCASAINGPREKISILSEPAGATVTVDCGAAPVNGGVTPTAIIVDRKADPCSFTLSKQGYFSERVRLTREISRAAAANKVPGVIVGSLGTLFGLLSDDPRINPGDTGGAIYEAGKALGSAPGEAIDRSTGAMYKHVPGEVHIVLRSMR